MAGCDKTNLEDLLESMRFEMHRIRGAIEGTLFSKFFAGWKNILNEASLPPYITWRGKRHLTNIGEKGVLREYLDGLRKGDYVIGPALYAPDTKTWDIKLDKSAIGI